MKGWVMSRGPLELIRVVFKSHGFCLNVCTIDVYASPFSKTGTESSLLSYRLIIEPVSYSCLFKI